MNLAEEAVGGLAAGVVGTVIGFPLDLVKTRMQTSSTPAMNMVGVATHVVRTEGILALYKGIAPPMISLSILNTMGFTSYSYWRKVYGGQNGWDPINGLAGMTGAPVFSIVSTLENLVKVCTSFATRIANLRKHLLTFCPLTSFFCFRFFCIFFFLIPIVHCCLCFVCACVCLVRTFVIADTDAGGQCVDQTV